MPGRPCPSDLPQGPARQGVAYGRAAGVSSLVGVTGRWPVCVAAPDQPRQARGASRPHRRPSVMVGGGGMGSAAARARPSSGGMPPWPVRLVALSRHRWPVGSIVPSSSPFTINVPHQLPSSSRIREESACRSRFTWYTYGMATRSPGRPKLPEDRRRGNGLRVRLTDAEWEVIENRRGSLTLSVWIRQAIHRAIEFEPRRPRPGQ